MKSGIESDAMGEQAGDVHDVRAELAACRDGIEAIDRAIVALLGQRIMKAGRAAELKHELAMPIADPEREAMVIRNAEHAAAEVGLAGDDVRDIFVLIVAMSRRHQERQQGIPHIPQDGMQENEKR